MSLLDDVSIVVTPNGYKAGTLFAVVPVPTEGVEKVTNGDFATDTDWIKGTGWTISGGTASCDGSQTGTSNLYQYTGSLADKIVKMVFTISNYSAGHLDTSFFGASGTTNPRITANGDYTFYISIQSGHNGNTGFSANSSFIGSIDNVSVKEYTAADMDVTRATAATRVDEAGLVNYAEIVGSELAICGDFECASPLTGWTDNAPIGEISIDSGRLKVLNLTNRGRSYRTYTGLTIGKTYEAFVGNTSGDVTGFCHITSGTANNNITLNAPFFFVAGATTAEFQCGVNSTVVNRFTFFDNISLKQNDRDNVPRIDYSGGGCPHILAEPQRTNLITYSEDFSSWTGKQSSITLTSNSTISPNGLQDATKIVFSDNSQTQLFQYVTAVSGTVYATSVFVKYKSGTDRNITIGVYDSGFKTIQLNFNTDGTIASTSTSGTLLDSGYEDYGNGWYRAYIVHTGATTGNIEAQINRVGLSNTVEEFYIWGEQLEVGSFPTSYIPTSGSTVTRNQDQFSRDGIGSLIGQTEGTFFIELSKPVLNFSTQSLISLNNAASNSDANSIAIGFDTGDDFFIRLQSNNVLVFQETETNADTNTFYKVAISYKSGESLMYLNGSPLTPTSGNLSNAFTFAVILDNLSFDFRGDGALPFFGKVKQLQVYKTALTDTQLAALTS